MRRRGTAARLLGVGVLAATLGASVQAAAETPGNAKQGERVFIDKQCFRCHMPFGEWGGGPKLEALQRRQGVLELTGRLWNHAPAMFEMLKREGHEWPRITAPEMADLMAYLQAEPSRDPPPDLFQGQVILVRKGCLKCHSLRGEGGSVGIEFTKYQGGYDSTLVWAAAIWNHSPRMADHAKQMGILYPRFTSKEMVDLYGYLRHVAAPQ